MRIGLALSHSKGRLLLVGALLLLQAGCSGLKNCSSIGAFTSGLVSFGWSQTCSATYTDLSEAQDVRITFDDISVNSAAVAADVTLTTEQGTARLTLFDGDGHPVVLMASPEQPATYTGSVRVASGPSVNFEVAAPEGAARNVYYEIRLSG